MNVRNDLLQSVKHIIRAVMLKDVFTCGRLMKLCHTADTEFSVTNS